MTANDDVTKVDQIALLKFHNPPAFSKGCYPLIKKGEFFFQTLV